MTTLSKSLKILFVLASVFILLNALPVKAQIVQRGELLRRMDAHNKALSSLKADVVMLKTDAALGKSGDEVVKGTVNYIPAKKPRPVYIRVDWVTPKENMIVVGDDYRIIRPVVNQAFCGKKDGTKQNARLAGPLAFLNMSKDELNANYEISYPENGESVLSDGTRTVHILLTPKSTGGNYRSADLWVDVDGMPRQARVTALNNDTTTILLTNISKNIRLDAQIFSLELPKGISCTKT